MIGININASNIKLAIEWRVTNMAEIPDAAEVGKLIMENDRVRVLDFKVKPNEKIPMHNHSHDYLVCFLTDAKVQL